MIWGGVRPALIFLVMFTCRIALCQDIDTVIFEHGYRKTFTILDQIEDPGERKAFQSFIDETSPAKRRALAEKFISNYPQSRFLAHAYDVASRASADLEDLEASLDHGARSLKLLPENPLLLVSLANVQVHRGMLDQAESSATLALEYFDRFRRPARYTEQQWAELEPRLRASCHYVLGRVAVARAIPAKGAQKHALTRRAQESLLRSRDLYDQDAAAAYLLGLTTLALGDKQEAANHFADAHRLGGPMAGAALKQLETIGMNPRPFRKPASRATGPKPVPAVARYSGSESCKGCHGKIYESWRKTGMARMFRSYEPGNVLGDFAGNNVFRASASGPALAKAVLDNGRHFFEFPVEGGQWRRYPVDYTIGSKWQQAYATRLDSGQHPRLPHPVQPRTQAVAELLGDHRPARIGTNQRAGISRDERCHQLSEALCSMSHQPTAGWRKGYPPRKFHLPGARHQLRNVPWAVGRSHCTIQRSQTFRCAFAK